MPEPIMTLSLLLGAAAGGVVEALVGRAADKAPALLARARNLAARTQTIPASTADAAVRRAVEEARQEMLQQIAQGDLTLTPADVDGLVALLDHPPFAESIVARLLVGAKPDWERLHADWRTRDGDDERWQTLQPVLFDLFDAIQQRLYADPDLGPWLRDLAKLAELTNLHLSAQVIADASRDIADSTARGATTLTALLQQSGRQTATLAEIKDLLAQIAARPMPGAVRRPRERLTDAEKAYLGALRRHCNRLPLANERREQNPEHTQRRIMELTRVYVDLQTTAAPPLQRVLDRLRVPEAERARLRPAGARGADAFALADEVAMSWERPDASFDFEKHPLRPWAKDEQTLRSAFGNVTALEVVAQPGARVLLGQPGSGKSTFINHLALILAGAWLDADSDWAAALHGQLERPLFPLRIVLRRWSKELSVKSRPGRALVYEALRNDLGLPNQQALLARLNRPETLVLFDGLDEAPLPDPERPETPSGPAGASPLDRRRLIVESVQDFISAHHACRILVTSRIKPYRSQPDYQLQGAEIYELADLDMPRSAEFVRRWYAELARVERITGERRDQLTDRLLRAIEARGDLQEMAGTPLLLTMLAQVNVWAGLPESRAHLYHECVEQLLWEWEQQREGADGGNSLDDLLREAPWQPQRQTTRADVERCLWNLTFDTARQSGQRVVDLPTEALEKRLAPLHPHPHAGKAWASRLAALMQARGGLLVETDTGHFGFPHLSFQDYLSVCGLLQAEDWVGQAVTLADSDDWTEVILLACGELNRLNRLRDTQHLVRELMPSSLLTPDSWRRLLTAGQAWLEFGPQRRQGESGEALYQDMPFRLTDLMQSIYPPPAQRLAAGLLAAELGLRPADLDAFVRIEARTALGYDFYIGKYPVTNCQYQEFMEAGGYDRRQPWWDEQARRDIRSWLGEWPSAPRLWGDRRFGGATQPVVGVSWYEARAYCAWLIQRLRRQGAFSGDDAARLPTVEEWQWVAAGAEQRPYPWGRTFQPKFANTEESGLQRTTPVHMYPDGKTPQNVWDLAGNVWEWTASRAKDGWPILMGGSWWNDASGVGAAARDAWVPRFDLALGGFRVVVVPVSRA